MRIKTDWDKYLHEIRTHEFKAVFDNCPVHIFGKAIELGAGDGFVSTLLAEYCGKLISTDLNAQRLRRGNQENITYQICDAENVAETFNEKEFDLVFSSNLLEHLPNCHQALIGMYRIMKDDGIAIHYLPNRCWKLTTVLLYVPNKLAKSIDKILSGQIFKKRKKQKTRNKYEHNNPKTLRRRRFFLSKLLLPRIHGTSSNTIPEFLAFGKKVWTKKVTDAGFEILAIKKVGFNSGYGFGFGWLRKLIQKIGIHSSYAYIAKKAGCESSYSQYFQ